jgi:hypothetical protein
MFALVGCDEGSGSASAPAGSGQPAAAAAAGKQGGGAAAIDLSPAGDAFKGLTVSGPAGAKVESDGAGGAQIAIKDYQLTITPGKLPLADIKAGAKIGAETVEGKITFKTDTADALEFVTELKDIDGKPAKAMGFALHVTVDGKQYGCSSLDIAEEVDLPRAKDVCKSLAKAK